MGSLERSLKQEQEGVIRLLEHSSLIRDHPKIEEIVSDRSLSRSFMKLLNFLSKHRLMLHQYYTETEMSTLSLLWTWLSQINETILKLETRFFSPFNLGYDQEKN